MHRRGNKRYQKISHGRGLLNPGESIIQTDGKQVPLTFSSTETSLSTKDEHNVELVASHSTLTACLAICGYAGYFPEFKDSNGLPNVSFGGDEEASGFVPDSVLSTLGISVEQFAYAVCNTGCDGLKTRVNSCFVCRGCGIFSDTDTGCCGTPCVLVPSGYAFSLEH